MHSVSMCLGRATSPPQARQQGRERGREVPQRLWDWWRGRRGEAGQDLAEYALLLGIITLALLLAIQALSGPIGALFERATAALALAG